MINLIRFSSFYITQALMYTLWTILPPKVSIGWTWGTLNGIIPSSKNSTFSHIQSTRGVFWNFLVFSERQIHSLQILMKSRRIHMIFRYSSSKICTYSFFLAIILKICFLQRTAWLDDQSFLHAFWSEACVINRYYNK